MAAWIFPASMEVQSEITLLTIVHHTLSIMHATVRNGSARIKTLPKNNATTLNQLGALLQQNKILTDIATVTDEEIHNPFYY